VAPASPCAEDAVRRGALELESLGFEVAIDDRVFAQAGGYLAGEPARLRAAHLQELFADPAVAGIVCVRGGYGSAQILPCSTPTRSPPRPRCSSATATSRRSIPGCCSAAAW
jgi:muramoyltetrapeptide carboxypeptidase